MSFSVYCINMASPFYLQWRILYFMVSLVCRSFCVKSLFCQVPPRCLSIMYVAIIGVCIRSCQLVSSLYFVMCLITKNEKEGRGICRDMHQNLGGNSHHSLSASFTTADAKTRSMSFTL